MLIFPSNILKLRITFSLFNHSSAVHFKALAAASIHLTFCLHIKTQQPSATLTPFLASFAPSSPILVNWTSCEPLAPYCPPSLTPVRPEERNIALIHSAHTHMHTPWEAWRCYSSCMFLLTITHKDDEFTVWNLVCLRVQLTWLPLALNFCLCFLLFPVDFLAKYCIFSQEKLAEYKRAFEAVSEKGFKPFIFPFFF